MKINKGEAQKKMKRDLFSTLTMLSGVQTTQHRLNDG